MKDDKWMNDIIPEKIELIKKEIRVLQETEVHYNKMIDWAKGRNPREKIEKHSWRLMNDDIGEVWFGECCPLCHNFDCTFNHKKPVCPLSHRGACYKYYSPWQTLVRKRVWGTWVKAASDLRDIIIELRKEREEFIRNVKT